MSLYAMDDFWKFLLLRGKFLLEFPLSKLPQLHRLNTLVQTYKMAEIMVI